MAKYNQMPKLSNMKNLLKNTKEAFYWAGFLCADAYIAKNNRVSLAIKDKIHLYKFAKFVEWKGKIQVVKVRTKVGKINRYYCVRFMDRDLVKELRDKFDFNNTKTLKPPRWIPSKIKSLRSSYAIGFIDGDGSIKRQSGRRRDSVITIKCHMSHKNLITEIVRILTGNKEKCSNHSGYAHIGIYNSEDIKRIKIRALGLKIPLLKRKWDVIDLKYKSMMTLSRERNAIITTMLKLGNKQKDICKKLGMSSSGVSLAIKRMRIKLRRIGKD